MRHGLGTTETEKVVIIFVVIVILALTTLNTQVAIGLILGVLCTVAAAAGLRRWATRRAGDAEQSSELRVLAALEGGGGGGGDGGADSWEGSFDLSGLGGLEEADRYGDGERADDYGHAIGGGEMACIGGEYTDDPIGGDERMTRNSLARNDPVRPTIGLMRRRREMEQYFAEELDEAENSVWWGNHEY